MHWTSNGPKSLWAVTSLAGYPAPGLVAVGAAVLISRGHASLALLFAACLALLMLVKIRTVWGVFVIAIFAGAHFAVIVLADPRLQSGAAHLLAWILAAGAVRSVTELAGRHLRGTERPTDATHLAKMTGLPAAFWVVVFSCMVAATFATSAVLLAPLPEA